MLRLGFLHSFQWRHCDILTLLTVWSWPHLLAPLSIYHLLVWTVLSSGLSLAPIWLYCQQPSGLHCDRAFIVGLVLFLCYDLMLYLKSSPVFVTIMLHYVFRVSGYIDLSAKLEPIACSKHTAQTFWRDERYGQWPTYEFYVKQSVVLVLGLVCFLFLLNSPFALNQRQYI